MVRIKICGITSLADAQAALAAGADALGFVFYTASPRCVTFRAAHDMLTALPPFVAKVGVFVNPEEATVRQAIACGLDTLQFHGDEAPEFCRRFTVKVIKAFRLRDAASLKAANSHAEFPWLLDSYVPGQRGGTGEKFNWDLAVEAKKHNPLIILAGGLTPANVAVAIRKVQPYAVDVSSGVEYDPGKKDPALMRAFINAAKSA